MRILVVHRYYWPDNSPCAGIMHWIAKHFASKGHEVDALSSQPSYGKGSSLERRPKIEVFDGVNVRRLSLPIEVNHPLLRILNAVHLGIWIFFKAYLRKYDVIIVTTVPPVLGGWFSALAAKFTSARLIYYCMDLHPEVGRVSGDFANPLLFAMLKRIDDWTCQHANPVFVHSKDMRNTLLKRPGGRNYNIQIMNNFSLSLDEEVEGDLNFDIQSCGNCLTMIYAGNVGRFQGLEAIVEAMTLITEHKKIVFIIMGDGVAKEDLISKVESSKANVRFIDHQPVNVAKRLIKQADIGLVSLLPEMYKYAYPSKVMSYLEQGKPIIAAVESESELSMDMELQGYGFSVPIGDPSAIAEILVRLESDNNWKKKMNEAALIAFKRNYTAEFVLNQWLEVVEAGSASK
jgi:glycosyltransferase involved in cell wall biosynthesis